MKTCIERRKDRRGTGQESGHVWERQRGRVCLRERGGRRERVCVCVEREKASSREKRGGGGERERERERALRQTDRQTN
eukprot:2427028-Rhodomonas_salina.1